MAERDEWNEIVATIEVVDGRTDTLIEVYVGETGVEDYDCIEIAYLFDDEPPTATYESLFDVFLEHSEADEESDELDVIYGNETNASQRVRADASEVAQIARSASSVTVSTTREWEDVSIGFSRTAAGFPTYASTPYLRFSTWIYALDDPDREPLERVRQRRRTFVELHARAADVLEPRWGFGRRGGLAIGEDETLEALAARTTPPLYEYNVFRPETVEALGRERVRSAPAWFVEGLDNGGAFLAVREPPRQCSHVATPCLDVADHLGIPLARPERYH